MEVFEEFFNFMSTLSIQVRVNYAIYSSFNCFQWNDNLLCDSCDFRHHENSQKSLHNGSSIKSLFNIKETMTKGLSSSIFLILLEIYNNFICALL